MTRVLTAAAAALFGMALQLPQAFACEANAAAAPVPGASTIASVQTARAPHYEWQQHYVGHHGRVEGHWVLVN